MKTLFEIHSEVNCDRFRVRDVIELKDIFIIKSLAVTQNRPIIMQGVFLDGSLFARQQFSTFDTRYCLLSTLEECNHWKTFVEVSAIFQAKKLYKDLK